MSPINGAGLWSNHDGAHIIPITFTKEVLLLDMDLSALLATHVYKPLFPRPVPRMLSVEDKLSPSAGGTLAGSAP